MGLRRHERVFIIFLLRHLLIGVAGALAFGTALLSLDLFSLRTLIFGSDEPFLFGLLLFFGLFVTFGSVAMGIGIMTIDNDE